MFTGIVQTVGVIESRLQRSGGVRMLVRPKSWPRLAEPGESICVSGVCLTHAPSEADAPTTLSPSGAVAEGGGSTQLLAFDIIRETLDKSMLGDLGIGDQVNLEPSLRADSLIAGHFVQGHVDGCGRVVEVRDDAEEWRIRIEAPMSLRPYLIPKGSIAIDGVSLTVAALDSPTPTPGSAPGMAVGGLEASGGPESPSAAEDWFGFEVALIPTTVELTTLGQRSPGDRVNLEADAMAKTIVQWLELRFGTPGTTPGTTPESPGIAQVFSERGRSSRADAAPPKTAMQGGVTMELLRQAGFDDKAPAE